VPTDSPSAQLRWLFYPDHLFSLPVPSEGILAALPKFLNEPALKGVIWGIITEVFKDTRAEDITDESIGDFLSRRINRPFVENVVSAVFHGVYAGDVWQLSAKSLMSHQWHVEKEDSSVILGIPHLMEMIQEDDLNLIKHLAEAKQPSQEIVRRLRHSSVFTLRRGLGQLTERLESLLKMGGNVTFKRNTPVNEIVLQKDPQKIKVSLYITDCSVDRPLTCYKDRHRQRRDVRSTRPSHLNPFLQNPIPSLYIALHRHLTRQTPTPQFGLHPRRHGKCGQPLLP
jgi:oxygen-dependent protoporphyrinogen oxidase